MKIIINYELKDKIQEAKTGFSLKKYKHKLGFYLGIVGLARFSAVAIGGMPIEEALEGMIFPTIYGSSYFGLHDWVDSKFKKERSEQELRELSQRLRDIFVETDSELLKDSYAYHTEYKLNSEKFPPKLEEHKYIMVPVHNDWGNNERSLHQEHFIGTRDYALSYGEPEKEKVYSYATKKVIK